MEPLWSARPVPSRPQTPKIIPSNRAEKIPVYPAPGLAQGWQGGPARSAGNDGTPRQSPLDTPANATVVSGVHSRKSTRAGTNPGRGADGPAARFGDCSAASAPEILAIFNDAILTSTAIYDYRPRTLETMQTWFEAKRKGRYPILGAFAADGSLLGFASYGPFRAFPAYKYTVEHSVYVRGDARGKGVGRALMLRLIESAKAQDYHVLIGVIDSENKASVRLHESLGFACCAGIRQAGFKFGRWLDLEFYQLVLPTPAAPVDG